MGCGTGSCLSEVQGRGAQDQELLGRGAALLGCGAQGQSVFVWAAGCLSGRPS